MLIIQIKNNSLDEKFDNIFKKLRKISSLFLRVLSPSNYPFFFDRRMFYFFRSLFLLKNLSNWKSGPLQAYQKSTSIELQSKEVVYRSFESKQKRGIRRELGTLTTFLKTVGFS